MCVSAELQMPGIVVDEALDRSLSHEGRVLMSGINAL